MCYVNLDNKFVFGLLMVFRVVSILFGGGDVNIVLVIVVDNIFDFM